MPVESLFTKGPGGYAEGWLFPCRAHNNEGRFGSHVRFAPEVSGETQMLLFDPETSGGLLIAVPPEWEETLSESLMASDQVAWLIGEVIAGSGEIEVVR
ncbi:MAG: AIR synthase-related protein [Chloroflexota bacterium]